MEMDGDGDGDWDGDGKTYLFCLDILKLLIEIANSGMIAFKFFT